VAEFDAERAPAIAIVGMAGRFPGSRNIREFQRSLEQGVECIRFFNPDELMAAGVPREMLRDPGFVPACGFLDGIELFDADFFQMPPREAEITDPQHRLLLECAWEVLEDSGHIPESFDGAIGVFAGTGDSTYLLRNLFSNDGLTRNAGELNLLLGNSKDFAPTRVSYKLRLKGPSVSVTTACSTGLVAVHLACQSLLAFECDLALAGGAGIQVPQDHGYLFHANGIVSPDGHCRPFDQRAAGTVHGNGVAVVALRRLEDAIAAGDDIRAIIRGSAINNDGGDKAGFTAPSVDGQARVIREALSVAAYDAESIGYVETHGTATPVGDPVEIAALVRAFGKTSRKRYCAIGSVKSNVGHLNEAAGVAGLIKTVLALQSKQIPPSLHYTQPNPDIDFTSSPFFVNDALRSWSAPPDTPRRAGVSSFGIGGTNAHVVLEEAPPIESSSAREWQLLTLSARSSAALDAMSAELAGFLQSEPRSLADVAFTLHTGRREFEHRRAVLCRDVNGAVQALRGEMPGRVHEGRAGNSHVAFLFPGQGTQFAGMSRGLYESEPVFREAFDRCAAFLRPITGEDITTFVQSASDEHRLRQTALAQPLLFACGYATARLWMSLGVNPQCMAGHSVGEYVAAHLAGVFSLEDALRAVAERGRLMQALPPGAMLSLPLSVEQLQPHLNAGVTIALENAPDLTVVAGEADAIREFEDRLTSRGITSRRLHTSHAFHSPMMEPAVEPFRQFLSRIRMRPPEIPFLSNLTGDFIQASEATSALYWSRHLRAPVRFSQSLATLARDSSLVLLEVGAGESMRSLAQRCPEWKTRVVISSGRHPHNSKPEQEAFLSAAGQLWSQGVPIRWKEYHKHERRLRVSLPTYPFERQRYWIDPPGTASVVRSEAVNVDDWFYVPRWEPSAPPPAGTESRWIVFGSGSSREETLLAALRAAGQHVERAEFDPLDRTSIAHALAAAGKPARVLISAELGEHAPLGCELRPMLFLARELAAAGWHDQELVVLSESRQVEDFAIAPAAAAVMAAAHSASLEIGVRFRGILAASDEAPDAVARELRSASRDRYVGLRNGARFVRSFVPGALSATPYTVKASGTYLITGGLGSMGLEFARSLAAQAKVRLVLIGRNAFPTRETWDALLSTTTDDFARSRFQSFIDTAAREHRQIEAASPAARLGDYPGLQDDLHQLCVAYVADYLRTAIKLDAGSSFNIRALEERLEVKPSFRRFYNALLSVLVEDGYAERRAGDLHIVRNPPSASVLHELVSSRHPQMRGVLRLLQRCAGLYAEVLRGALPGNQALFPDGSPNFLRACGSETISYSHSRICLKTAAHMVAELATGRNSLSILEAGGGSGDLTSQLLEALNGENVSYRFTDISRAFVAEAERIASDRGIDSMQFGLFDISRDPRQQGLQPHSFDVVVAYNVVHVAPDITAALEHLRLLLKPGGHMVLVESTRLERWDLMCWGLAEDIWAYPNDAYRSDSPLLSAAQWEAVIRDAGFALSTVLPSGTARETDTALIIARNGADDADQQLAGLQRTVRRLREIEQLGSEVMVRQADVSDPVRMQEVLAEVQQRFGHVDGIIHTAGVILPALIRNKSTASIRKVLRSKIEAVRVLAELCDLSKLDFLMLCSSAAAITPLPGQFDYAAANAWLDAFAHHASRCRTISVNWNFWQEAGMIADTCSEEETKALEKEIREKGWSQAGVAAFESILRSCGVPQVAVSPVALQEASGCARHPLLSERLPLPEPLFAARSWLSVDTHWEIRDHRPGGIPVLPGTAYLEIALAAYCEASGREAAELRDVVFLAPMVFSEQEARELRVILKPAAQGYRFFIVSRERNESDQWAEHATGYIGAPPADARPRNAVAPAASDRINFASEPQHPLAVRQQEFSPRWRCLRRLDSGEAGVMTQASLPAEFESEGSVYRMHPALLDMIVGSAAMRDGFEDGLPFSYERIRVWKRLPLHAEAICLYRDRGRADTFSLDLTVCDRNGDVCVEIENYVTRRLRRGAVAASDIENFALFLDTPGSLASIEFRPTPRPAPAEGEIEIEVAAAGVNFIEVLFALGMLPQFNSHAGSRFGLECSGRVARVGKGVHQFRLGDEVIAFSGASCSRFTIAEARCAAHKPAHLDLIAAATIPAAYCTAYYALITQGRLRANERVLIHAAAGGVGLAAVQIAQWIGAEIFATAGSDAKRSRLRELGVPHVMNSRTTSFAAEIADITNGGGVNVVCNSLAGDFLNASLSCLAPYGRFIEIGKRSLVEGSTLDLGHFAKRLAFIAIDVGTDLPGFEELWRDVMSQINARSFGPLPFRSFPIGTAVEAFQHMAQARHFGKIVLDVQDTASIRFGSAQSKVSRTLQAITGIEEVKQTQSAKPSIAPQTGHQRPDLSAPYREPLTDTEKSIAAIWEQLLGIQPVGIHDNFFDLHGDSLLASLVTQRIEHDLQVRLSFSTFFDSPTVAQLAAEVDKLRNPALAETEEEGVI